MSIGSCRRTIGSTRTIGSSHVFGVWFDSHYWIITCLCRLTIGSTRNIVSKYVCAVTLLGRLALLFLNMSVPSHYWFSTSLFIRTIRSTHVFAVALLVHQPCTTVPMRRDIPSTESSALISCMMRLIFYDSCRKSASSYLKSPTLKT